MALKIRIFRYASPRPRGEGLRLGVTRFLPRGVRKTDNVRGTYFDVWYPMLAPSHELLSWRRDQPYLARGWPQCAQRYRRKVLGNPESRHTIQLLAALAQRMPIAIGCYCADEAYCQRSLLKQLIEDAR